MKNLFSSFGKKAKPFKRVLNISEIDDKIYFRHYFYTVDDLEEKYKVSLKEIGPKITLKLINKEEGFFEEYKKSMKKQPNNKN